MGESLVHVLILAHSATGSQDFLIWLCLLFFEKNGTIGMELIFNTIKGGKR